MRDSDKCGYKDKRIYYKDIIITVIISNYFNLPVTAFLSLLSDFGSLVTDSLPAWERGTVKFRA